MSRLGKYFYDEAYPQFSQLQTSDEVYYPIEFEIKAKWEADPFKLLNFLN